MVKRKAAISLDEWLVERRVVLEVQQPEAGVATGPCINPHSPVAKTVPPQEVNELITGFPAEVDITEEEAANWFWSLLEQAGFER